MAVFCSEQTFEGFAPWQNYGAPHATAAFYKDQLGIVHLKGLVKTIQSDQSQTLQERPIFRLPPGYRPATRRVFASVGSMGFANEVVVGRVDVLPDGIVELVQDCIPFGENGFSCSANGQWVTLDGLAFRPSG